MRIGAIGVVALLVAGCNDADIPSSCDSQGVDMRECHADWPGCGPDCKWEQRTHVVRWSFQNASTGMTSTCLPGNPAVTLKFRGPQFDKDCALGEARVVVPAYVGSVSIESAGTESTRMTFDPEIVDVPAIAVTWNGGYTRAHWVVQDSQGNPVPCGNGMAVDSVYLYVDDVRVWQAGMGCAGMETVAGPIAPGVHTLRATAYGLAGDPYTPVPSSSVDLGVEPGVLGDGPTLTIRLP